MKGSDGMAMIKCPECRKDISDQAASCPNCGCPSSKWRQVQNPQAQKYINLRAQKYMNQQKPMNAKPNKPPIVRSLLSFLFKAVFSIFLFFGMLAVVIMIIDSGDKKELPKEEPTTQEDVAQPEEYYIKEEFTTPLDYRELIGNPNAHIGEKFVVDLYVFSDDQQILSSKYYKCWINGNPDRLIFVHDHSGETILSGDQIRAYGVFNGNDATKNYLTNEKGEVVALDVYFIDILEAAE